MPRGRSGLMAVLALVLSTDYTAHASDDVPDVHVEIIDESNAVRTELDVVMSSRMPADP